MTTIAVTGATGYIGGRLVPRLLAEGYTVRVLTRRADALRDVPWGADVDIIEGDLTEVQTAERLCSGADVVYFLVHSMASGSDFESTDERCARAVAQAAADAEVGRLVYLSGLHPQGKLSQHLRSRVHVGEILEGSGVPTLTLQAGLVIGSGSASFEMIRHLTDVLPLMPSPRWVMNKIQPIAVRDALHYLIRAAEAPLSRSRRVDIGGPEVHTYADLMKIYAKEAHLREPTVVPLPLLTPRLAAQWVNLVTPIPRSLAIPLVESLQNDCVVQDHSVDELIAPPPEGLTSYARAVSLALEKISADGVETTWAASHPVSVPSEPLPSDPDWSGRAVLVDERVKHTTAAPAAVFDVISSIGGEKGYFSLSRAWRLRGLADKVVGGVGLGRGRRRRTGLALGDTLDWWRVETLEQNSLLRLRAEMKVPGQAWLEFRVEPEDDGTRYAQRAIFFPAGLSGRLYWLALIPFHAVIFRRMATRVTSEAEASR
ncbi:SDR family oxidoreductase [Nesterenkonia flava]|uniref:SDR family oxidoreductase n=1 Tax=Nesterenkonia flava TaxID=469799 RepID=A0ABU1FUB9_9MICC|nr:SDR family oxidoreductase [Nesterenkonia flava]MDR5711947.1 SDR family oxidoreductase [Nesterenkonia flava]